MQKTDPKGRKFIIITTKIMNGNALIHREQMMMMMIDGWMDGDWDGDRDGDGDG